MVTGQLEEAKQSRTRRGGCNVVAWSLDIICLRSKQSIHRNRQCHHPPTQPPAAALKTDLLKFNARVKGIVANGAFSLTTTSELTILDYASQREGFIARMHAYRKAIFPYANKSYYSLC